MDELRKAGDSCGARIDVVARGVPVGLGEPLFDKLDADIAHAMMGINAVKGVEIGAGFASVAQRGSDARRRADARGLPSATTPAACSAASRPARTSRSRIAIKPTSSIRTPRRSIDRAGQPTTVETFGRHDPCVGIRATPIAEAMLALVLMDHALRHRAQCGDVAVATAADPRAAPPRASAPRPTRRPRRTVARVRRGLVRLLRVLRALPQLRAAVVPEPRLLDPGDRRARLAAERDPGGQPLCLGLDRRPHRPARAHPARRRRPVAVAARSASWSRPTTPGRWA